MSKFPTIFHNTIGTFHIVINSACTEAELRLIFVQQVNESYSRIRQRKGGSYEE